MHKVTKSKRVNFSTFKNASLQKLCKFTKTPQVYNKLHFFKLKNWNESHKEVNLESYTDKQ